MKRYELKDKERQAALEKALPEFKEALQRTYEKYGLEYFDENKSVTVHHYAAGVTWGSGEWMIALPTDDIEVIEEYNPKGWNDYPEVTPPERVLMQIEGHDDDGDAFHFSGYFRNKLWVDEYSYALPKIYTVERFRPWDEKEDK